MSAAQIIAALRVHADQLDARASQLGTIEWPGTRPGDDPAVNSWLAEQLREVANLAESPGIV